MWELQVCTVCFSTGVKLYNLNVGTLRNDFNSLSGLQMVEGNGLPQYLCVECAACVTRFIKFRQKCHRAHYALIQMLCQTKEIKMCHIKNFNRDQLHISPTLSYMKEERAKNYKMQYKLVNFMRRGVPQPPGLIHISHCIIPSQENVVVLDMKVTQDDEEPNIKTEKLNNLEEVDDQIDQRLTEQHSNNVFSSDQNGEVGLHSKSIIKQALDMIVDNDFSFDNNESSIADNSDAENKGFDQFGLLSNKIEGAKTIEVYGDVVPISFKEARAAYEVYKYCSSQGEIKCYCGKYYKSKALFEFHAKQHNMVSGKYRCEICDIYFKTTLLREMHMSEKHMYKYLCKMCPEVSFTKRSAKLHYQNHIDPTRKKTKIAKKKAKNILISESKDTQKIKPRLRKKKIKIPDDFLIYTPQTQEEQYMIVQARMETRNYLEAKFRCELCYRGFRMTVTYNKHMVKHDESISGPHQCDACKQYFRTTRMMYKHMVTYHTRKYACLQCQFTTTNLGQAWIHYKWHKNVTYDCPHCDKKFKKISTQLTHIRFKHPGTDVCSICGHSFVSSSGLNCHRISAHSKEERDTMESLALNPDTSSALYCTECRMQFASRAAFATHLGSSKLHVDTNISSRSMMSSIRRISRAEGGEPSTSRARPTTTTSGLCALGPGKGTGRGRKGASLLGSSVLNTGATTATNCEVCGLYLASDVLARRHYDAEHPGTDYLKRYMCDICGHTTRQYANLLVHMRTHTREKPYECPFCDRRFSMTSNRDRHLVVHTGEKRYQCQHCSRRFTQSTAVKLHIQTVHMKIPYKPWEKKNRKRRKDAQINTAGVEVTDEVPTTMNTTAIHVPQHKLVIGDPQGEYITYISYSQEQ